MQVRALIVSVRLYTGRAVDVISYSLGVPISRKAILGGNHVSCCFFSVVVVRVVIVYNLSSTVSKSYMGIFLYESGNSIQSFTSSFGSLSYFDEI